MISAKDVHAQADTTPWWRIPIALIHSFEGDIKDENECDY